MSIHIQINKNDKNNELTKNVHLVPFKVHADCDAAVSKYFTPLIKKDEDGNLNHKFVFIALKTSFRGLPLLGTKISIPDGYVGAIFHESVKPVTDKEERKFYVVSNFKDLTYWNWDKVPTKNDAIQKAFDWIDIADALHSPIMEE